MADIPQSMQAVEISGAGGPEVLKPATRPVPSAGANEILVKVAFAGINGPDLMQRRGLYPPPKGASDLLGLEISGEVAAVGDGVTRWHVGDRVCALTNGGGYAEYCAVLADHCLPIPDGLGLREAASLPETFFTIWSNIFMTAGLSAGETFLVHGGAGGIGTTAIQLGKAFGATVVATDSPGERCDFCSDLGADRVVDYDAEDFVAVVRDTYGGADVILDIVGGPYIARNIKAAKPDGRIVQLAFARGAEVTVDLMPIMLKRLTYTGSTLRSRPDAFKTEVARQLEERVWPLFAEDRLKPVVDKVLPLAEAAEAHRLMESATHKGKILLAC
ncbi:MAG: NAD(P)H-quinone oxidoreductase [Rhodospirillales bacterium]|nr:MAG: NAD(P)H-quinone oxidoreductase [Rhodospirillales bacterium]